MKNFIKNSKITLSFFALFLCAMGLNAQTTITIDNNPGSTTTYTTLQDAYDNAAAGDIIYVQPSPTPYGSVILTKPISIIGRSHSEPLNISRIGTVTIGTSGVVLKGLYLQNGIGYTTSSSQTPNTPPFVGLDMSECRVNSAVSIGTTTSQSNPAIVAEDVNLRGNVFRNITVYSDSQDVTVANNIISSSGSHLQAYQTTSLIVSNNVFKVDIYYRDIDINNFADFGALVLFNNMFLFNNFVADNYSEVNLSSQTNSTINLTNNLTYNFNTTGKAVSIVAANATTTFQDSNTLANIDPLFSNIDITNGGSFAGGSGYNPSARLDDDITLQAGSPALTGGINNTEIGLYSNGFDYRVLGNPKGLPVMQILSYDGAVPINGNINVSIQAEAK